MAEPFIIAFSDRIRHSKGPREAHLPAWLLRQSPYVAAGRRDANGVAQALLFGLEICPTTFPRLADD